MTVDLKGENQFKMDIVMNEFLGLIRKDPRITRYETRILAAFFEIESEESRHQTLTRVVDFMKNCLPKLRENIEKQSSNQGKFRPIKEFDGPVLVVRHENWEALCSWMPLEMIQNPTLTYIWYAPMLAFYLSDKQLSDEDLKKITVNCRRRRDQVQNQQSPSSNMVTHNNEKAPPVPARRSTRATRGNYTCPICFEHYDQSSHKPMIIPGCGHTFCQTCVNRLDKCPECRDPIQRPPIVNFAFKNAIEERDDQMDRLKSVILNQENEKKTTEEAMKFLQNELETKLALQKKQLLDAETFGEKVSDESIQEKQKAQLEIENLKKQLAEMKKKAKLETENKVKKQAPVEKHTVLVSGLPEKKPTATKIFKDLMAEVTDDPLKIEFVKPASLGQALLTFNQLNFAQKFITLYNQKKYGDTDFVMKIELFKETSPNNLALPTKDQHSDSEISRSSSPLQRNRNFEIDLTKIYIQNLPAHASNQSVIKWIFKDNPNLVRGSLSLKLEHYGAQTCIAKFQNETEVNKIIDEFNGKVYPGTESILSVRHFRTSQPKGRSKSRDPQSQIPVGGRFSGRPSLSPTRGAQAPRSNFSNPAKKPQNHANFYPNNSPMLHQFPGFQALSPSPIIPPMMPQFLAFQAPPPPYQTQIFPNIYQNNQIPSSTIFISNLPLSTSRADLIEHFHNKTLEGEPIQIAEVDGIVFLPTLQPNPIHKACLITFKTSRHAQLAQRYFSGKPFQNPDCLLNIMLRELQPQTNSFMRKCYQCGETGHFAKECQRGGGRSGGDRGGIESGQSDYWSREREERGAGGRSSGGRGDESNPENRVLIRNLPSSVTANDLVEVFHQICKIAHDQDLRPRISLSQVPNGTTEAIICFQTLEGAQRIALLYKEHDFQGRTIHASLI